MSFDEILDLTADIFIIIMRSHKTCSTRDRSNPTQLAKMSFDEILDLTAGIFYNTNEVTYNP